MITVYGHVTEIEPTTPPRVEVPEEPPPVIPEGVEAADVRTLRQNLTVPRQVGPGPKPGRRIAVRSGATLQQDVVHPGREVVPRGETVQDGEAILESRTVETDPERQVDTREGEEQLELESWVHVHVVLDPPHAGEIEIDMPGFAAGGMLAVGNRARVMLSAS